MKKIIPVIFAVFITALSFSQAPLPQVKISNGILEAVLYLPNATNGYYRATRFDWSGNMPSLKFGGHEFYGQWFEKYDPFMHDAVMGPVEEFDQTGYGSVRPGTTFLKVGVGMLEKPDEKPYDHFRLYTIKNGGEWSVRSSSAEVVFTHKLSDDKYSYLYEKIITLVKGKAEMVIHHSLKNLGSLPIETTVYNHNFPVIDKQPAGPAYTVVFKHNPVVAANPVPGLIAFSGNKLIYLRLQKKDDLFYFPDLTGYGNTPDDYDIIIQNSAAKAGIRVKGNRPLARLAFWSSPTTVCPEPYTRISAEPGQEITWDLTFSYFTNPE